MVGDQLLGNVTSHRTDLAPQRTGRLPVCLTALVESRAINRDGLHLLGRSSTTMATRRRSEIPHWQFLRWPLTNGSTHVVTPCTLDRLRLAFVPGAQRTSPPPSAGLGRLGWPAHGYHLRALNREARGGMVGINADAWSSQLEAVLAMDHQRLRHLLVEAGRDTGTPGVRSELVRVFAREVAAHVAAEEEVLTAVLQHDAAAAAAPAGDELQHAAGILAAAPDDHAAQEAVASALELHVSVQEGEVLPRLHDKAREKQLAVLAERFAKAREAAPS